MKNAGFKNHLSHRFFERYGKLITNDDINKMNHIILSCPHLKYTTIRHFDYLGMKVYCYVKSNRIVTFLTEKQAMNTQRLHTPTETAPRIEGVFSLASAFVNIKLG